MSSHPGGLEWVQPLIMIASITLLMMLLFRHMYESRKAVEASMVKKRLMVIEECGGRKKSREYREGDYVGKVVGECEGGKTVITGFYTEVIKPREGGQPQKA